MTTVYEAQKQQENFQKAFLALPTQPTHLSEGRINAVLTPRFTDARQFRGPMTGEPSFWSVALHKGAVTLTSPYSMGATHVTTPTVREVMLCLLMDASNADQPFEDWAGDLGYDDDSRKAEAIYDACVAARYQLIKLLGPSGLVALQEALDEEGEAVFGGDIFGEMVRT